MWIIRRSALRHHSKLKASGGNTQEVLERLAQRGLDDCQPKVKSLVRESILGACSD
jgi:hypothetical protein